ncbi:hypothetical protein [Lacticaseibacillus daqingensis]|uniref:hypothetical protein n=1 Tax=Lacticaseibacillus daqingensis TaxID=2486014 RepID=UPI0013DE4540|nr:hypothetical protein [Lacticaseibacillus daqingensis]
MAANLLAPIVLCGAIVLMMVIALDDQQPRAQRWRPVELIAVIGLVIGYVILMLI